MGTEDPKSKPHRPTHDLGAEYQSLRRAVQATIIPPTPLAYSIDGRTFGYEISPKQAFPVGAYVRIRAGEGVEYLGQVSVQEVTTREGAEYAVRKSAEVGFIITSGKQEASFVDRVRVRVAQGSGELIGRVESGAFQPTTSRDQFEDAPVELASPELIAAHLSPGGAGRVGGLDVGYALSAEPGVVRVRLRPKGFGRHTFMCGQSRSGKTFALGVILEQILFSDTPPLVIVIDPNSDFVRIREFRTREENNRTRHTPLSDAEFAEAEARYGAVLPGIRVFRPAAIGPDPLRVRLSDLTREEQGAVLQMHPVRDLNSFNSFTKALDSLGNKLYSWQVINERLASELSATTLDLVKRVQNLRVADWGVWCQTEEPSIAQTLRETVWRCAVVDVGTLPSADQRAVATLTILNFLWETRRRDRPILLVLEEAHNTCPHEPANQLEEIMTDYVIRIAGEGLKYGLRLLLASQRPGKIHPSVLTQCENLILMRMNSATDLADLAQTFSRVPPSMLAQSRYFTQGESLLIGEIVPGPTFAKFEGRLTHEGGADAPVTA